MANLNYDAAGLTAEQKELAEKLGRIFSDEENRKKISSMRTAEDVISFYEDNGYSYTEEQKDKIREVFAGLAESHPEGELTEEELLKVAGGWSWEGFFTGTGVGAVLGGIAGGLAAGLLASNPVGWAIGGALVVAGGVGTVGGLFMDEEGLI